MDNYRKAIAVFIQESGVTSNAEFQSGIANVKDNYLGDDNVAIMSEVRDNNGTLLAHPVINGTTYQIALTPRINDNGTLINWECDIRNETDNLAPPSGAMPRGCNVTAEDLNDDQEAYIDDYNSLVEDRTEALTTALNDYTTERTDRLRDDDVYQGYVSDVADAQSDIGALDTNIADLRSDLRENEQDINTADARVNYYQNAENTARENAATARANADAATQAEADAAANAEEYTGTTAAAYTAQANAFDSEAEGHDARVTQYNTEADDARNATAGIQSNLDNALASKDTAETTLATAESNRDDEYDRIDTEARTYQDYDNKVIAANTAFNDSLESNNTSDAFSGDHVDRQTDVVDINNPNTSAVSSIPTT